MTLADKFKEGINFPSKTSLDNCEKIADEFAIGFAKWCFKNFDMTSTIEQLLEIYKKENQL